MKFLGNNSFLTFDTGEASKPNARRTFKTANALTKHNIEERNLFSDLLGESVLEAPPAHGITDIENNPVSLSKGEWTTIKALQRCIASHLQEPEIQKYIQDLPFKLSKRLRYGGAKLKESLTLVIDVIELAKDINATDRIGGKHVTLVNGWINDLAKKKHHIIYKVSNGGTIEIDSTLISLFQVEHKDEKGNLKNNLIEITFEDIFLYGITQNGGYSLEPANIFTLLKDAGTLSGLFRTLYDILTLERGIKVKQATKDAIAVRKSLKDAGATQDEIEMKVQKAIDEALTVDLKITTLFSRFDSKKYFYSDRRRGQLRKDKIEKDKREAVKALETIGIIQAGRFYESTASDGSIKWNFIINPNWIKDEKQD